MIRDNEFQYMMLARLKSDCEYFLGFGNRNEKHLWALSIEQHITQMRKIWNSLDIKPEWLSRGDIEKYAIQMQQRNENECRAIN